MTEYETEIIEKLVKPKGEPIFSERATSIRIEDEAGGCFVVVCQCGKIEAKIQIDPGEWPAIREAIEWGIATCNRLNGEQS